MSLPELIAEIKTLPRADKACLMKTLLDELIEDNAKLAEASIAWEIRNSPSVAYALQQLLHKERAKEEELAGQILPAECAVWSPYDAYEAADTMKKATQ